MTYKFNNDMNYIKCPCKECEHREIIEDEYGTRSCHSCCLKYNTYKDDLIEIKKIKAKEDERYIISDTKKKWLREKQRKNGRKNSVKY